MQANYFESQNKKNGKLKTRKKEWQEIGGRFRKMQEHSQGSFLNAFLQTFLDTVTPYYPVLDTELSLANYNIPVLSERIKHNMCALAEKFGFFNPTKTQINYLEQKGFFNLTVTETGPYGPEEKLTIRRSCFTDLIWKDLYTGFPKRLEG